MESLSGMPSEISHGSLRVATPWGRSSRFAAPLVASSPISPFEHRKAKLFVHSSHQTALLHGLSSLTRRRESTAGAPMYHIKEVILLWRGTLKDFILRYSFLPAPIHSRPSVLGLASALERSLARLFDECPPQSQRPWCHSTGSFP